MAMTADLMVLSVLCDKNRYKMLINTLTGDMLSPDLMWLLKWFKPYWKAYPTHTRVDPEALLTLIKLRSPLSPDREALVEAILDMLKVNLEPEEVDAAVQQLTDRDLAGKASKLILEYQAGEEVDLSYELQMLSNKAFETSVTNSSSGMLSAKDAGKVLENLSDAGGVRFDCLKSFDEYFRPMLPGDTVLIAAAPGAGKTSFLAFLCTSIAPQLDKLYGNRPILWLNNEGSGEKILSRVLSSALNKTYDEVMEFHKAGTLIKQYSDVVKGEGRILIRDAHGYNLANVERLVQTVKPCVVVFDMMANFTLNGDRNIESHEKVERLWQVTRELAVKHNFIAIGTSQFSLDGVKSLYPSIVNLKDSKIGVQGAIETMIFMGKSEDEAMDKIRYFSCPKVKRVRTGATELRFQAYFDTDRCRFDDGH